MVASEEARMKVQKHEEEELRRISNALMSITDSIIMLQDYPCNEFSRDSLEEALEAFDYYANQLDSLFRKVKARNDREGYYPWWKIGKKA